MSQSEDSELENSEADLGYYIGDRNEEGERHGVGKAHFPNGDNYEGDYARGKRHGKGVYKFTNCRARYEGDYYEGKKHGTGIMVYPDATKYEGTWIEDSRSGEGIYTYRNGDIYDGFWIEDQRHGYGTYTFNESGTTLVGKWQKGQLQGSVKVEFNEHCYEGKYQDGMFQGNGKYIFKNQGIEQLGQYIINQLVEKRYEDNDEETEYFVPTERIAHWISEGIQPIVDRQSEMTLSSKSPSTTEIKNVA